MKKSTVVAMTGIASLALSLGACGLQTGSQTPSPSAGNNRPSDVITSTSTVTETAAPTSEAPVEEIEEEPVPELTGTDPGILKMGDSFTYSDGLQITVSKPSAMTSSEWAYPESTQGLAFTITVVNGTGAKYDPSMGTMTVQSGNTEAEEIFDTENGYEGSPMTTVLPGREATYKSAFVGTDTKNLVLEFSPDFDRGSLIFTPNGK